MRLATFTFTQGAWSSPFPALDSERTLVLAFGSSRFIDSPQPLQQLAEAFPRSALIGCSSAGEILDDKLADETIAVAVAAFDEASIEVAAADVGSAADSHAAGKAIAERLNHSTLRSLFVLSDGLGVNGTGLVDGINGVVPSSVVVSGGLAADGDRFKRTWVIDGKGRPRSKMVAAVGLHGGGLHVGHGSRGGWDIFGPERVVTRAEGNVLYELDGAPALQLYKTYLGDRASGLPATALLFPLSIRATPADDKRLVRTILAVDEEHQSMTFAGDIPAGWRAQLMRSNNDRLVGGAADAAHFCTERGKHGGPVLAIAISCVGRRLVLGERTEEELEVALEAFPDGSHQVGFYSYGEISPFAAGACDLHNQTMTLTTISEA
jgi:hypothetical protein